MIEIWDENKILNQGYPFLEQKNEILKTYVKLWLDSYETDYFNQSAKIASRQFKKITEKSRKAIKILDKAIIKLLKQETLANPRSEKTLQLEKISSLCHAALNYFTSVVNDLYYPTYFNQSMKRINQTAPYIAFALGVNISLFQNNILPYNLSGKLLAGLLIAITASRINIICSITRSKKVTALQELFENSFEI